jgi:hypothetical protein
MARTGKIARLPRPVRDELNRRLEHNLPGRELADWLNSLPEVKEVLAARFQGKPISEQNLSEWRQGGFAEWETRQDLLEETGDSAQDAAELDEVAPFMAGNVVRLLTARILTTLRNWNGDTEDPAFDRLKRLSSLINKFTALQCGEHATAKLSMEQHAFDLACEGRASFTKKEARDFPVTSPPLQKWARRFNVPDPGPPVDPHEQYCRDYIYALTRGLPRPTPPGTSLSRPEEHPSPTVPPPDASTRALGAPPSRWPHHNEPPSPPPESPAPSQTKSNQIKPPKPAKKESREAHNNENPSLPRVAVPILPTPPILPNPAIQTGIVTTQSSTIPYAPRPLPCFPPGLCDPPPVPSPPPPQPAYREPFAGASEANRPPLRSILSPGHR